MKPDPDIAEPVRLDKWLWSARFFKTRSLAIEAANGGKVHVNGLRAKPGRDLKVGDQLVIRKEAFVYEVVVRALSIYRGPASVAQTLYEESESSRQKREMVALALRSEPHPLPGGRPTKKDRRAIIRFRSDSLSD
ncbi:MAG: RNA-binding protein [Magnetococcales bacterium]|nr:RNA-binding protein [Magnetococcales bacterium]